MNIDNAVAASVLQGLGYVTSGTLTITVPSFSFGAGATQGFSGVMSAAVQDAASLTLINFSGVGNANMNNSWALLPGALSFRNSGYDIGVITDRTSAGQTVTIQFYNPTGAGQTVPNITVSLKAYFYTAPW